MSTNIKHKTIVSVVLDFYNTVYRRKPDAAEFKAEYKIVELLLFPKEDFLRGYTPENIIGTVNWLVQSGVVVKTMKILHFEHIMSSFVDQDIVMQDYILNKVKFIQQKNGLADPSYDVDKPIGW